MCASIKQWNKVMQESYESFLPIYRISAGLQKKVGDKLGYCADQVHTSGKATVTHLCQEQHVKAEEARRVCTCV